MKRALAGLAVVTLALGVWKLHGSASVQPLERMDRSDATHLAARASQPDPDAKRAAVALSRIADPAQASELTRLALDGSQPVLVRANAIRGLAGSGGSSDTLVALAVGTEQPLRVRQEAALALRTRATAADADAIAAALDGAASDATQDGEQVRIALIVALRAIDAPSARAALERHAHRSISATERAFL